MVLRMFKTFTNRLPMFKVMTLQLCWRLRSSQQRWMMSMVHWSWWHLEMRRRETSFWDIELHNIELTRSIIWTNWDMANIGKSTASRSVNCCYSLQKSSNMQILQIKRTILPAVTSRSQTKQLTMVNEPSWLAEKQWLFRGVQCSMTMVKQTPKLSKSHFVQGYKKTTASNISPSSGYDSTCSTLFSREGIWFPWDIEEPHVDPLVAHDWPSTTSPNRGRSGSPLVRMCDLLTGDSASDQFQSQYSHHELDGITWYITWCDLLWMVAKSCTSW